jgi:uncharacterized damage-inducible protein DinB
MRIIDLLLPEYDREMGLVRKTLERVPEDRFAFKPHERSWSIGELAGHLANLPTWASETMKHTALDLPSGARLDPPADRAALLASFDERVRDARQRLAGASDAELMVPWTFKVDGREFFTMPRATVLRNFVLNHAVHHRGQLTVYLRLLDVPVPSLYGPSADEGA